MSQKNKYDEINYFLECHENYASQKHHKRYEYQENHIDHLDFICHAGHSIASQIRL